MVIGAFGEGYKWGIGICEVHAESVLTRVCADLSAVTFSARGGPESICRGTKGARGACVAAALWPERCAGLVSVNGYLIQAIAKAGPSIATSEDSGPWYQNYFQTERGLAGLKANRRELARTCWVRNSPNLEVRRGHARSALKRL